MSIEYLGASEITGPFIVFEGVKDVFYDELVILKYDGNKERLARVSEIYGDKAILQVFEGTKDLSLDNVSASFTGKQMELSVSEELLGRVFDGVGRAIDGLGKIYEEKRLNINSMPINPVSREYPRDFIQTGISSIDGLMTLIRGQKLPIFSADGLPHNQLAAQIVRQAKLAKDAKGEFAIVFAAMGVKNDVADFFRKSFEESNVLENVTMFLNLANDPVVERIITPRVALTAAEYLAYEKDMHILLIMTDMTSYAEAIREISSAKGEIPSRKGYPGYLYSDLASLYERAGILKSSKGSLTQIPILTMPNDDITHPVPDLTGYITEGQIVLDRKLHQANIYPPVSTLPSLSRLMKDGIGEGYTRKDHADISNQLFASYAELMDIRSLVSVIGEDELSESEKKVLEFGKLFEEKFLKQGYYEDRTIDESLELAWEIVSHLDKSSLDRLDRSLIDEFYQGSEKDE